MRFQIGCFFTYQLYVAKTSCKLQRHDNVSACSGTFKLVSKMGKFFGYDAVALFGVSGCSGTLRCQLVHHWNVSKILVSFRYQLWRPCIVLSWSVSLRYQLVRRCDISNWSVLFSYQWDVAKTPHWHTNCDNVINSQNDLQCPNLYEYYMRRCYDLAYWVGLIPLFGRSQGLSLVLIDLNSTFFLFVISIIRFFINQIKIFCFFNKFKKHYKSVQIILWVLYKPFPLK